MESGELRFGGSIEKIKELILSCNSKTALIIEAPLSGVFSESGNPAERGDFEKGTKRKSNRYWYSGPGAAMCLASIFFLRKLSAMLPKKCKKVYLYEGFITGNRKTGKHSDDAEKLLKCFMRNSQTEKVNGLAITILDVIGAKGPPPAIIFPKQK
jgi:hypothetical protein